LWFLGWLSIEITYGLYLSDHSILDGIDTELIVLSGIMIQNLQRETGWHLRGTRRIGVSYKDVEAIQQCVSSDVLTVSGGRGFVAALGCCCVCDRSVLMSFGVAD